MGASSPALIVTSEYHGWEGRTSSPTGHDLHPHDGQPTSPPDTPIAAFQQRRQQTTPSNTRAGTKEGDASGTSKPSDAWAREALTKNKINPNLGFEGIRRPDKTTIEAGAARVTHSTHLARRTTRLNLTTYFPSPCIDHKGIESRSERRPARP